MTNTLLTRSLVVIAAGGIAWLAKVAVIAASDGATSGFPDAATGVLYLAGVALMTLGLAGAAVALTAGRHAVLRALAGLAGIAGWGVLYVALEAPARSLVADAGPAWLGDEVGILVTAAVVTAAALAALRARIGGRVTVRAA